MKLKTIIMAVLLTALLAGFAPAEDLTQPSGMTSIELASALRGDLRPLAWAFVRAEQEHGVNAIFLAAVAALESGWGESTLAEGRNNLFGWTSASGYSRFPSKRACIDHVARFIAEHYLAEGGKYYQGKSIDAVCIHYNGRPEWTDAVRGIMDGIERRAKNGR